MIPSALGQMKLFTGGLVIDSWSNDCRTDIGLCCFAELYGRALFYDVREALIILDELICKPDSYNAKINQ